MYTYKRSIQVTSVICNEEEVSFPGQQFNSGMQIWFFCILNAWCWYKQWIVSTGFNWSVWHLEIKYLESYSKSIQITEQVCRPEHKCADMGQADSGETEMFSMHTQGESALQAPASVPHTSDETLRQPVECLSDTCYFLWNKSQRYSTRWLLMDVNSRIETRTYRLNHSDILSYQKVRWILRTIPHHWIFITKESLLHPFS